VNSPLDDAMRELGRNRRIAAGQASAEEIERERTRNSYRELIRDFLSRMNRLGNPGTESLSYSVGRFRSQRFEGWRLLLDRIGERPERAFLTTDGRLALMAGGRVPVPAAEVDFAMWGQGYFKDFSLSMAEILTRYE
jgi:hypothetical protein